jgi:N-formylglutamate deformylase
MMTLPFDIVSPAEFTPLVYDSPHSGRSYPHDFVSNASPIELRRGEDAYVDELLAMAPVFGASLLTAKYARCYIDLNRAEDDIDAAMLAEPWPGPLRPTEKTARGLGLIRRYVVPGVEAQARLLTVREVRHRIDTVYRPYHDMLRALVNRIYDTHNTVCHVNWHSMKSVGNAMTPDGQGAERADFVVSDVLGTSAHPGVTEAIVGTLREMGYSVSVNDPYLGGTIVKEIGAPKARINSVQVEINRRLYLDEGLVEKTDGFSKLAHNLDLLTQILTTTLTRLSHALSAYSK